MNHSFIFVFFLILTLVIKALAYIGRGLEKGVQGKTATTVEEILVNMERQQDGLLSTIGFQSQKMEVLQKEIALCRKSMSRLEQKLQFVPVVELERPADTLKTEKEYKECPSCGNATNFKDAGWCYQCGHCFLED